MLLVELLRGLLEQDLSPYIGLEIQQLTADSRNLQPGALFLAYQGSCGDSKLYLPQAVAKGAAAVLIDQEPSVNLNLPYLVIPQLSSMLPQLADSFFGNPQDKLTLYAVTGTNGKSSVSYYLAQMLNDLGIVSAVIGTTGWGVLPNLQSSSNTTPGVIELRAILANLVQRGVKAVVMEVSSHGLAQQRVAGLYFHQAIFTNLTQDHLDYHGNMENYAAAKFALFNNHRCAKGIFNVADTYGLKFSRCLKDRIPKFTYGAGIDQTRADLTVSNVQFSADGISGHLHHKERSTNFQAALLGNFNLDNIMAAASALLSDGVALPIVADAIGRLQPVKGRMEIVKNARVTANIVVVDYAHTPDALAKALISLRGYCRMDGKLWVVFGCGGDRDRDKRAKMGRLATELADKVMLTNDNPRGEDPMGIIREICAGIEPETSLCKVMIDSDRGSAIRQVLRMAGIDDVVLIAGKGHEQYQITGNSRHYFSDQQQILDFDPTLELNV